MAKKVSAKKPLAKAKSRPQSKKAPPKMAKKPSSKTVQSLKPPAAGPALTGREAARQAFIQKAANSKWAALYEKADRIPTASYKISAEFSPETAIQHKTLGWGYVLSKKK